MATQTLWLRITWPPRKATDCGVVLSQHRAVSGLAHSVSAFIKTLAAQHRAVDIPAFDRVIVIVIVFVFCLVLGLTAIAIVVAIAFALLIVVAVVFQTVSDVTGTARIIAI
ncbi:MULTISPECIES: hypothetical protein [unclassified Pseudomonas]|uniref:hypothetical protein n=1 Tax=unclassified Pseudomonas TaxID=196821 RepID=UPI0012E1AA40|nr:MULTISPECIES: hypothetical protein [unclassified Pseudomonas]WPN45806.1 hypothetical protein QMK58_21935 [Pseudomonas sp. P8_241]